VFDIEIDKSEYSKYEYDSINYYDNNVSKGDKLQYRLCTTCQRYFPKSHYFFSPNKNNSDGLATMCKSCHGNNITHPNKLDYDIILKFGNDSWNEYKEIGIIDFSKKYNIYFSRHDNGTYEKEMIKYLIESNRIEHYTRRGIISKLNSIVYPQDCTKKSINYDIEYYVSKCDFNFNYRHEIWRFNGLKFKKLTLEEKFKNIDSYIKHNNIIIIDNIFEYNKYYELLKDCKCMDNEDRYSYIELVLKYYNNEYPAYKFHGGHINYWKNKDNRIYELKWYIENDMKLDDINKLPLYLTKGRLNKEARSIYYILQNYYNGELFNWVDKCYPNMFKPKEFNIWYRRDEFDSIEEQNVHEILVNKFGKSLYYNCGDASQRLTINGCQPDWLVLCEKPIIIEYFGMYSDRTDNTMLVEYTNRTNKKISYYDSLSNYDKIYIYPSDLKNGNLGLINKLEMY